MTVEQPAPTETTTRPAQVPRWRRIVGALCIVASCILAPISALAIWTRNQVLDTDRYVQTVAPLASDPAIIEAVANDVTQALFDRVDVEQEAKDALPKRAQFLAGPLASGLEQFTTEATKRILETEQFQKVWERANRIAHEQVDAALTGGGDVVSTADGKVVVNLSPIVVEVRSALADQGIGIFDNVPIGKLSLRFELFDAQQLEQAQSAVGLLNTLSWFLPVLAFALLGVGVWLSPRRRRTVIRWGIGTAIALGVLAAVIGVGRAVYLNAVSGSELPRDAAAAAFDTVVRFLRGGLRFLAAAAVITALVAWVTGPGRAALKIRTTFRDVFGGIGDRSQALGWDFGDFGRWVHRFRSALRVAGVILALLLVVIADRPSAARVIWLTLFLLVYLAAVEFVSRAATVEGELPPTRPGA